MTIQHYQDRAMSTCMDTCMNPVYMMMNLNKLASRKERGVIDGNGDNR